MDTYHESILRREIFPKEPHKVDIILDVCEMSVKDYNYVMLILNEWTRGESTCATYRRLQFNIIDVYEHIKKKCGYLDNEFKEKMKE